MISQDARHSIGHSMLSGFALAPDHLNYVLSRSDVSAIPAQDAVFRTRVVVDSLDQQPASAVRAQRGQARRRVGRGHGNHPMRLELPHDNVMLEFLQAGSWVLETGRAYDRPLSSGLEKKVEELAWAS